MGMGLRPGLSSGELTSDVEGVTIVQSTDSGTSILVLNSVGNGDEGLYSCVAVFPNGTRLNSSQAGLTYNREFLLYKLVPSFEFLQCMCPSEASDHSYIQWNLRIKDTLWTI